MACPEAMRFNEIVDALYFLASLPHEVSRNEITLAYLESAKS
jgi:hypothetical protein